MRTVIADASSLILLAKCSMLKRYAAKVELLVPRQVFAEVAAPSLQRRHADAALVAQVAEDGLIRVVVTRSRRKLPLALGAGEAAAIRLFFEAGARLVLTDDGHAIRTCRLLGVPFSVTPRVVVDLAASGAVGLAEARRALEKLAVIGRYSREIIAAALVALHEVRDGQTDDDTYS